MTSKSGAVMVLGAGIAGIQASLDLANSGFKVYLVEEKPNIGGVMPQLDKTFPTNDCAMCILAPKLVDTGRHPNIEILTRAEIEKVEGEAGNFKVRIKKLARYVDIEKCTGCGDCATACPVEIPNEFESGLVERKAIYRLYPQAIPNAFAIDKRGTAPCRVACPAGVNAQGYVALISQGKFYEADDLIRETNPFPSICGRICNHPCEEECNRGDFDEPVAIRPLKRFVGDYVRQNPRNKEEMKDSPAGKDSQKETPSRQGKVAIVGSGPAGLTTGLDLRRWGYEVTVFEAMPAAGGMLRYGIPRYRLSEEVLDAEIKEIVEQGVEIKTNSRVGKDFSIDDLKKQGYQAIFLAIGAHSNRGLKIEGLDLKGVLFGISFLRSINLKEKVNVGEKVIVVGGGNVAIDVARSALRLGARNVHLVCLESHSEMPAHSWEIEEAEAEGIELHCSQGPERILGNDGKVAGLKTIECASVFDSEGRFNPTFVKDHQSTIEGDTVIIAIGQTVDFSLLQDGDKIKISGRGTLEVDPVTLSTNVAGIFAGGDVVSGPASVVDAVGAAHQAAISIDRYLSGKDLAEGRKKEELEELEPPERVVEYKSRQNPPLLSPDKRVSSFQEIELEYTEEMAVAEAKRCLNCGNCSECLQCVDACEPGAIDHQMKEEEAELEVGAIIVASGFQEFRPELKAEYGYSRFPNVLSSIEFERTLSASGPYKGHVVRPSDKTTPKKVAWIQCVGSRDASCNRSYCSSVCCMYATKEAVIAKEHVKGMDCHIYFMDMRSYGKDFDKYYERAKDEYGVRFRRCRVSSVEEISDSRDLKINYQLEDGKLREDIYNLVVLSVGLVPSKTLKQTSHILGIELNEYGFAKTDRFSPVETSREGIYVCGVSSGPKDIPETVTEASAAAAKAAGLLSQARGTLVTKKTYPEEIDVTDQLPRIGVFICHCGINIGGIVDVPAVVEHARDIPNVAYAEANLFTCSQDTQEKIKQMIKEHHLNRVLVASCTPRTHEALFQDTIREAGLNPSLFEFANIRDQCSWVHQQSPELATGKAKDLMGMGVAKCLLLKAIQRVSTTLVHKGLVIGGGLSGMVASLGLAKQGFEVDLLEKETELGGNLRHIYYNLDGLDPQVMLKKIIGEVESNELIRIHRGVEIKDVSGYMGNYKTRIKTRVSSGHQSSQENQGETELEHGAIIVASGARSYEPVEYLYGKDSRVLTQKELEGKIATNDPEISNYRQVVMIQCVGSRDEKRPYCSRVCCSQAIKNALKLKAANPNSSIFVLYRDTRTYGFREEYYQKARSEGVIFVRYEADKRPEVKAENGLLKIFFTDPVLGEKLMISPDLLVLSAGIEPGENESLAKILKVPLTSDNFFLEAHAKLRPVDFATDGIFLCGLAHSPRFIEESISQANAAAARAATLLSKDHLQAMGIVVGVNQKWCSGCALCVSLCPYEAREIDPGTGTAKVTEVLCQGCGACAVACPNGVTDQKGFEKKQILSMIEAAL